MGFMFCDLHVSLNNPSSGDINSSNLPCPYYFQNNFNVKFMLSKIENDVMISKEPSE